MTKKGIKHTDLDLDQLKLLAERGWNLTQIAEFFKIPYSTLQAWMERYHEIGDAITNGIERSCEAVEKALFERAVGYSHPETKVMTRAMGNNQGSEIVMVDIVKHYPPETSAAIFYLTNKKRHDWRHRMELTSDDGLNRLPDLSGLSFSQVMELAYGESANTAHKKRKNLTKEVKDAKVKSDKHKKTKKTISKKKR